MADCGFGFSQVTIWKIERGQRPVQASELVALTDSLGIMLVTRLTDKPDVARHWVRLHRANRKAHHAYETLKEAAPTTSTPKSNWSSRHGRPRTLASP